LPILDKIVADHYLITGVAEIINIPASQTAGKTACWRRRFAKKAQRGAVSGHKHLVEDHQIFVPMFPPARQTNFTLKDNLKTLQTYSAAMPTVIVILIALYG
jgi:hypothetical protein